MTDEVEHGNPLLGHRRRTGEKGRWAVEGLQENVNASTIQLVLSNCCNINRQHNRQLATIQTKDVLCRRNLELLTRWDQNRRL